MSAPETIPIVATASYECPLTGEIVEMEVTGSFEARTGLLHGCFTLPEMHTHKPVVVTITKFRDIRT